MIFKEHKTNIQQILRLIPDELLSKLALNTKVESPPFSSKYVDNLQSVYSASLSEASR